MTKPAECTLVTACLLPILSLWNISAPPKSTHHAPCQALHKDKKNDNHLIYIRNFITKNPLDKRPIHH